MTLADTSVWVNHLRANDPVLVKLLEDSQVVMHSMVIGELACGNLGDHERILGLLKDLPQIPVAGDGEVLFLIERHRLMGRGIGTLTPTCLPRRRWLALSCCGPRTGD